MNEQLETVTVEEREMRTAPSRRQPADESVWPKAVWTPLAMYGNADPRK
jgi:hypothetical protein